MGCAQSQFQDMPVSGARERLVVVPGGERFVSDQLIALKLKEKMFSWSGDDFKVKDSNGQDWFKIDGNAMSMTSKAKLLDVDGQEICNYRKKMLSLHQTAYISAPEKSDSGQTMVLATIKRRGMMSFDASAEIFIHSPPVNYEQVTTEGMVPAIVVEGDMIGKNFDFMVGIRSNPVKIGQVTRKFNMLSERNSYWVTIGPNVDIAFLMIAAYAIDELFNDK